MNGVASYRAELDALASRVGERNRRLFTIALKGRAAGVAEDDLVADIVSSSGEPPLSEREVRRAVEKVFRLPQPKYRPEKRRGNPVLSRIAKSKPRASAKPAPDAPQSGVRPFVREMIELGGGKATSRDLMDVSPVPIRRESHLQALDFCLALNEPDSGWFFAGEPRQKRTRDRLTLLDELEAKLVFDDLGKFPTHILPNDLTGEPGLNEKGEESYALESCLLHRRYAVVEFDAMPLAEQAAFWLGAIRSDLLPIRSLVYSGGKSIHGLLRLKDDEDFKSQWRILESALCCDPDPAYRCDLACRNPGRMTRFPGAIRPETGKRQTLLYLA